jgi:hypothetical protein
MLVLIEAVAFAVFALWPRSTASTLDKLFFKALLRTLTGS